MYHSQIWLVVWNSYKHKLNKTNTNHWENPKIVFQSAIWIKEANKLYIYMPFALTVTYTYIRTQKHTPTHISIINPWQKTAIQPHAHLLLWSHMSLNPTALAHRHTQITLITRTYKNISLRKHAFYISGFMHNIYSTDMHECILCGSVLAHSNGPYVIIISVAAVPLCA